MLKVDKVKRSIAQKKDLALNAINHIESMDKNYSGYIDTVVCQTRLYSKDEFIKDVTNLSYSTYSKNIIVEDIDSVSAIIKYYSENIAILNFASFQSPGGKFIDGSSAQEENLCRESILYNVLREFNETYYKPNVSLYKNRSLYRNRALYSKKVLFIRDTKKYYCDVITCSAPNYADAHRYHNVSLEENYKVLESRVKFVLNIAMQHNLDTLILGAFGCGVFSQNPVDVAGLFKRYSLRTGIKNLVFAIPGVNKYNYTTFRDIFNYT